MTTAEILKRLLLLFILGILLYFAWVIYQDSRGQEKVESTDPQLSLNDFEVFRYHRAGILEYLLIGETLVHYDNAEGGYLTDPLLKHYNLMALNADERPLNELIEWTAKSDFARYTEDKSLLTLIKNLYLHKPDRSKPEDDMRITTDLLYIHDAGDKVTAELFVELEMPTRKLSGYGLIGYPRKEHFTLHRDVKSTYITEPDTGHHDEK